MTASDPSRSRHPAPRRQTQRRKPPAKKTTKADVDLAKINGRHRLGAIALYGIFAVLLAAIIAPPLADVLVGYAGRRTDIRANAAISVSLGALVTVNIGTLILLAGSRRRIKELEADAEDLEQTIEVQQRQLDMIERS